MANVTFLTDLCQLFKRVSAEINRQRSRDPQDRAGIHFFCAVPCIRLDQNNTAPEESVSVQYRIFHRQDMKSCIDALTLTVAACEIPRVDIQTGKMPGNIGKRNESGKTDKGG